MNGLPEKPFSILPSGKEKRELFISSPHIGSSMSRKDDFVAKRQMKAIKSRGKRHSTTVVGNMLGIFPEPLIEYSPYPKPSVKEEKRPELMEDMTISIDLDVKDIPHHEGFLKMLAAIVGLAKVEKDFEVLSTAEKIIRALAKAKFKNVVTIDLDGETLYHNPDDYYDTEDAIKQMITEIGNREGGGNRITMALLSRDHKGCQAEVTVSRYHMEWAHDILITIGGTLKEKYFREIMNYLEDHLDIEDIEDEWKKI